ncbi:MAG: methyltransferase domain-containing protein [Bacteroidota bacterium]
MRLSALIGHVVEVLDLIRAGRRPADAVVREFFRARHYLGASDRRYIAERTFDVVRHHALLTLLSREAFVSLGAVDPGPALSSVALVATHEVRCKESERAPDDLLPDIAGVWRMSFTDVECEAFLGEVRHAEIPPSVKDDDERFLSVRHSIPAFVVKDWLRRFGSGETASLCAAVNTPAPVTIRVNTLRCTLEECREALAHEGIMAQPTAMSPVGLHLAKRINAHGLHAFKQGWFEMQDEGSQVITPLTGACPGMTVVDACAGGGGKSLHLAALMNNRGRILAVDVDRSKLEQLEQRAHRAGVSIAETLHATSPDKSPLPATTCADVVLVDAPCSGTGTFRRSPWLKLNLTEATIPPLVRLQGNLLERYAGVVKPGGRLVYTTCSLLDEENRAVVERFLTSHPEFAPLPLDAATNWQLQGNHDGGTYLELLPHKTGTDGFFGAILIRSLR